MNLGVCYYPEHWPAERWSEDARLMRRAGLKYVRIGEFAWSKMEPGEDQFDWAWLDFVIDILVAEGLHVVLCTPTAAPPAWLAAAYPEILPVDMRGNVRGFGSRRHYCFNSPIFRDHSQRIVYEMSKRYRSLNSVVGWQIDNEFGCYDTARCYCESCAMAFRSWLMARYTTLDTLNQSWGTEFWSQIYSDWEQIDPPVKTVATPNPSHVLDYWRFSSNSVEEYQQLQIDILRKNCPGKFITHNFMAEFPDLDTFSIAQPLDFVSWDSYPTGYAEKASKSFYLPDDPRPPYAHDVGDPYVTGFCHDLTRGMIKTPFWIMEQQCGSINWSDYNTGVRPGAVRLWTWHAISSGAESVIYFRWRASRFGVEQYHSGMLRHDGSLDHGYHDVCSLASEKAIMDHVTSEPHSAEVALLFDYNDLWAIQLQPHRKNFSYLRHVFRYYRALVELGIQVDIVSKSSDLSNYKLIIAPTLFLVNETYTSKLSDYVENGGALIFGVRSGFKTDTNLVTELPLPGELYSLVGSRIVDWHALIPQVNYKITSQIPNLDGSASFWAEALDPEESEIRVRYSEGPFAGTAALTSRLMGIGQVYYVGWYPSLSQTRAILSHIAGELGIQTIPGLPEGVLFIHRGTFNIFLNFREDNVCFTVDGHQIKVSARGILIKRDNNN